MKNLLPFRSLAHLPPLVRLSLRIVQKARVPIPAKAMAIDANERALSPPDLPGWVPALDGWGSI